MQTLWLFFPFRNMFWKYGVCSWAIMSESCFFSIVYYLNHVYVSKTLPQILKFFENWSWYWISCIWVSEKYFVAIIHQAILSYKPTKIINEANISNIVSANTVVTKSVTHICMRIALEGLIIYSAYNWSYDHGKMRKTIILVWIWELHSAKISNYLVIDMCDCVNYAWLHWPIIWW